MIILFITTHSHVTCQSITQIIFWLQGLFVFALIWTIAGTAYGDSKKKFDEFYRQLLLDQNPDYPRPKVVKMTKVSVNGV